MKKKFDPVLNYESTKKAIGYVNRKVATQQTYDAIGFMSGLEVHQQLNTEKKLFCRCPAGKYQKPDDYDAEIIRHMRPTLSELGEYDGTALMEFKTRKEIIYRVKNETTCTYEVDDTPPFPLNRQALEFAIKISIMCKLNIVGEVHITRKQYLDGSIPTGFQRTAIIGVEGEIPIRNKKIRLIQLSLEEDSCREVSDIGHVRIYRTDRLGMPLIETVTYPDMTNPDEVKEACNYIRFLNRSSGLVRTGIGAGRQDVNVSCRGGERIEIKGVAHTKWIPELTHNECFRQWALLNIRQLLQNRISEPKKWKISHKSIEFPAFRFSKLPEFVKENKLTLVAVNLPGFQGMLSHFTQPGKMFADEISERLKVIACIETPNMTHSEAFEPLLSEEDFTMLRDVLGAKEEDAQILFWGPQTDVPTALETIEERCLMAFEGVPRETRKSFENGTTIFERVLPGADRMYPDTDSKPIPLENQYIQQLAANLPAEVMERYHKMKNWDIPEDTYTYIFKRNLFPLLEKIVAELHIPAKFAGTFFGHLLKNIEGKLAKKSTFDYQRVFDIFKFLIDNKLEIDLAKRMLPVVYQYPKMDFQSVLETIKFKKTDNQTLIAQIPFLKEKFATIRTSKNPDAAAHWIMGSLHKMAQGNVALKELKKWVDQYNQ